MCKAIKLFFRDIQRYFYIYKKFSSLCNLKLHKIHSAFHVLANVINHFPVYGSWVHMYVNVKERNNSLSYHQLNEQLESIYVGILLAKYTTYGVLLIFPFVYKNKILEAVRFLLSSDLFTIFFIQTFTIFSFLFIIIFKSSLKLVIDE